MNINWFTVIAQLLNFLILVWLLKKFLYKPILNAVNERERKITDELKNADAQKAEAHTAQEEFKKKNEDFDTHKKVLLDKAIADVKVAKQELMDTAKADAKDLGAKMKKSYHEAQEKQLKEHTQNTQEQVFAITRKALVDMASVSLEEQSVAAFIKYLKAMKNEEKHQFIDAFTSDSDSILIKSAFDLSAEQQEELTTSVNELLSAKTVLQFKTAPQLISGIELSTNGYKMAWSFSEYLSALQKTISQEVKSRVTLKPEKKEHVNP
jgi:F-type H+-transporting ATPase subunit b